MKLGTEIHDTQRMNYKDFGDPLTFPLGPPASQIFTNKVNKHNIHSVQAINHNKHKRLIKYSTNIFIDV